MFTIKENVIEKIEIKNSKFITYLIKVNTISDIKENLDKIKSIHNTANHHCYAYVLDNNEKCSDDKEPSGTAGLPMLNVLKNNNLNFILAITVRYFGGIKLGSGGLSRAYTKSITSAIEKATLINVELGKNITITFPYEEIKTIDFLLKDEIILNKSFDNLVSYNLNTKDNELLNKLNNIKDVKIKIEKELYF